MKLLTIVTLTKDNTYEFKMTINSILKNKYLCDYSQLLIIDGSNKNNQKKNKLIALSAKKNIDLKIIKDISNGIYPAMNQAIKLTTSKFILFLNSGDIFSDNFDQKKLVVNISRKIDSLSVNLIFCRAKIISILNKKIHYLNPAKNVILNEKKFLPYLEPPSHQACIFRTSWHKKNLYCTEHGYRADREIIIKAFKNSYFLDITLSNFYLSGVSSLNNQNFKKIISSSFSTKSKRLIISNLFKIAIKSILKNNWEYVRLLKHLIYSYIP